MKNTEEDIVEEVYNRSSEHFILKMRHSPCFCIGRYVKDDDTIVITMVWAVKRLKEFMGYLTKKYRTRNLLFYDIRDRSEFRTLRGFKTVVIRESFKDEPVLCLKGEWEL